MNVEKDIARILIATLGVVILLDILTHGSAAAQVTTAAGKAWVAVLAVLSGQRLPSGF